MAVKLGDVVLSRGCVSDSDGADEHPALVTKVYSNTEVDCVIFVLGSSGVVNTVGERHLKIESIDNPTGKRFIEKGA
jgi:hypothetical protein